jgi:hypothetical protein
MVELGMEKNSFETALVRVNAKAAAVNLAIEDIRRQEKEAKAALESLAWEEKEHHRTKGRIREQTKVLQHVIGGSCFHQMPGRNPWLDLCPKPAKVTCPDCGMPVCGVHNKVSKFGSRAHNCREWTAFKQQVIDGQEEEAAR